MTNISKNLLTGAALLAAAVIWIPLSQPIPSPVLMELTPSHGIHVVDLVSIPVGLLGVWFLLRHVLRNQVVPVSVKTS